MAAKKPQEMFLALYTSCGSDDQLQVVNGGDDCGAVLHGAIGGAQAEAEEHANNRRDSGEDSCDYVIVRVVQRGGTNRSIVWK